MPSGRVRVAITVLAASVGLVVVIVALSISSSSRPDNLFTTWVAMNVTQCANPWDEEKQTVTEYFRDRGILVYGERRVSYLPEETLVCSGCSCTSGSTLYLEVAEHDAGKMINEHGFVDQLPKL